MKEWTETDHFITRSNSKVSCLTWMYPIHIIFAYLVVIAGILALLSRVIHPMKRYHYIFGQAFLIFMYWAMGSSLLIYNTGLPVAIIYFFLVMLISLTVGWIAIKIHKKRKKIYKQIEAQTLNQRFFSFRTLHGCNFISVI